MSDHHEPTPLDDDEEVEVDPLDDSPAAGVLDPDLDDPPEPSEPG
jgi:hypothetical protein